MEWWVSMNVLIRMNLEHPPPKKTDLQAPCWLWYPKSLTCLGFAGRGHFKRIEQDPILQVAPQWEKTNSPRTLPAFKFLSFSKVTASSTNQQNSAFSPTRSSWMNSNSPFRIKHLNSLVLFDESKSGRQSLPHFRPSYWFTLIFSWSN